MSWKIADNRDPSSWATAFRRRRFALFLHYLSGVCSKSTISILDVGGRPAFWRMMTGHDVPPFKLTIMNVEAASADGTTYVTGDARALPFQDGAFDVVFSNSVIEHVGGWQDQQAMADEVRRVGRRYFIQTPNFWFPIEPHYLVPGFQFLPLSCRAWLSSRFSLGWMKRAPSYAAAKKEAASIQLLTGAQLRQLLRGCELHAERIGPFVKSWMACGGWESIRDQSGS
jgi:hypothetical protein